MGLLTLFRPREGAAAAPAAPTPATFTRHVPFNLPRIYWTIDGYPVQMADWSCNDLANLGYDQMRGVIASSRSRALPSDVMQGSLVIAWTEYGAVAWQGRLSSPPKELQDGRTVLAAQGHGWAAAKYNRRFPLRIVDPAAFQLGHQAPLNFPLAGFTNANMSLNFSRVEVSGYGLTMPDRDNALNFESGGDTGTKVAVAIWAPGARFLRFRGLVIPNGTITIGAADGPNIAGTYAGSDLVGTFRKEKVVTSTQVVDLSFAAPGDAVVVEWTGSGALSAAGGFTGIASFTVYADLDEDPLYPGGVARAIGDRLGWDTSRVTNLSGPALERFDWAAGAAAGLDEAAFYADRCWRVGADDGDGAVLEFVPYAKVWEVSARTGARWDLDPLELYNRIVAQFTTDALTLGQVAFEASPDPLGAKGLVNEIGLNLAGQFGSNDLPATIAHKMLKAGLAQRWRGRVQVARAFEAGTGREATY